MSITTTETVINYAIHPVAALFPYIEGPAFEEFVEDIRANGQREPVVLDGDGRLLDGRNRVRACQVLGIDVRETRYEGDDADGWIISHNVHRRHLSSSQRAMIAARLATLKRGDFHGNQYTGGMDQKIHTTDSPESSRSAPSTIAAANQLGVGTASVKRAKSVINSGDPDLIKSVETGEKTVTSAVRELKKGPSATPTRTPARNYQPADIRIKQIRALAEKGYTSVQIGKEIGIGEQQVRAIARSYDLTIRADVVIGHRRRLDHDRMLHNVAESLEVAVITLRDIDPDALDREEALERLDSLSSSINAIRTAVNKISKGVAP